MTSYLYEIPSSQPGYAVRQPKMAKIPTAGCGDDVDYGQLSLRYQPENPYSRRLFWHLIATVLLVAITVLAWLSLIGDNFVIAPK
jgi:hypothetical protein